MSVRASRDFSLWSVPAPVILLGLGAPAPHKAEPAVSMGLPGNQTQRQRQMPAPISSCSPRVRHSAESPTAQSGILEGSVTPRASEPGTCCKISAVSDFRLLQKTVTRPKVISVHNQIRIGPPLLIEYRRFLKIALIRAGSFFGFSFCFVSSPNHPYELDPER